MAFPVLRPIPVGAPCFQLAYDGTYIYASQYANAGSIVRIRASDAAYCDASGNITNLAGATFGGPNYLPKICCATPGRLWVGTYDNKVVMYDTTTGSLINTKSGPGAAWVANAFYVNGLAWFADYVSSKVWLRGLDSSNVIQASYSTNGNVSGTGCATSQYFYYGLGGSPNIVQRMAWSGGTITQHSFSTTGQVPQAFCYDGTYLWIGCNEQILYRLRESDMQPIDKNGAVCTVASGGNRFLWRPYSGSYTAVSAYAIGYDGANIYTSQGGGGTGVQIMDPGTGAQLGIMAPINGYTGSELYGQELNILLAGGKMWFPQAIASLGVTSSVWHMPTFVTPTPSLTDVSPGLTPQHISLTFDNPVGITGPTLGPKSGNLQVTSATQVDTTHIDLGVSIDPCPPTDVLTGAAQGCNVLDAPTGGRAGVP